MLQKRVWTFAGNMLPILVSLIIYLSISNNQYHLWLWYDAIIVPIFLLLINFIAHKKEFSGKKLLIMPCVIAICFVIHMLYFDFDFTGTSMVIWLIFSGISYGIMLVGRHILNFISKCLRS